MSNLRQLVFWPPIILVLAALACNFIAPASFLSHLQWLNNFVLTYFGYAFSWGIVGIFGVAVLVMFMPFGRVRIGGSAAKPLLGAWRWIAVSLCTNTAVGVLFWAAAEPLYHLKFPPPSLAITSGTEAAGQFAISTLFLHWSVLPSAIYAVPGLMFAFAFYNMRQKFSLGSALSPLLGERVVNGRLACIIDGCCLYSLVAGMAASLATGTLTLAGGLNHLFQFPSNPELWWLITATLVLSFIGSAVTGLKRGISLLSSYNLLIFLLLAGLTLVLGPTKFILEFSLSAFKDFLLNFWGNATLQRFSDTDPWPRQWTIFYWAVWLAWAPVTAAFLGRIARGYSVRSFLWVNLWLPAGFAILWMGIFGSATLYLEFMQQKQLSRFITENAPESIIYAVLEYLPFAKIVIPIFVMTVFISYVSGADANTSTMAGMCTKNLDDQESEPESYLKIIWGLVIGTIAVIVLQAAGVEGIKMLSNLGGLPALVYVIAASIGLLKVAFSPLKYDCSVQAKLADTNPPLKPVALSTKPSQV